jgi:hypothetical protein
MAMNNDTPINTITLANKFVIVDGLNLIHRLGHGRPQLTPMLLVVLEVAANARDFSCVFDASTKYALRGYERWAYEEFVRRYPDHFIEVTARTQADPVILAEAAVHSAIVVSNDVFKKYFDQYPWVKNDERVIRANRFRDHLHFLGRRIPIPTIVKPAVRQLNAVIERIGNRIGPAEAV